MTTNSIATAMPKPSTTTKPTTVRYSNTTNKSSLLRASFAPSSLQLHLFASVIQSFEHQQLRLHDTNTGRLRQQHAAALGAGITSLSWGHYGFSRRKEGHSSNRRKRKRNQATTEDVVIAYSTSTSDICMYSPSQGRVINTLPREHERGVYDFKFAPTEELQGWSIGGDGKLVQWDLAKDQALRSISLPDASVRILCAPSQQEPQILCASTTPFAVYPSENDRIDSFDSFKGQIHSLIRSRKDTSGSELFLAADLDRYVNVFDTNHRKLVRTLVTGSEAEQLDLLSSSDPKDISSDSLLAVVTREGTVELFSNPFKLPTVLNGDVKSRRKSMTRKANAQVKLINDAKKHANILAASIQGPDLLVVSVDGGVDPSFQKIRWQDEGTGELLFEGIKEIQKVKTSSTLSAAHMNGVKDMGKAHVDESRTVVANGAEDVGFQQTAIEISSGEEEGSENDDEDEDIEKDSAATDVASLGHVDEASGGSDIEDQQQNTIAVIVEDGKPDEDAKMQDAEDQEPSFGDLLASKHPNTIAIADSFALEKPTFDADRQLALPSGMSLGTVLTQALRTNDKNLLESCLHANEAGIIQNTIQRLDSGLAAVLLSKLAERLASRPGRYGHLISWVQWTCIAHGGAIAGQADTSTKIRTLYRVLSERSQSLDKLLLLKGKLDMLNAQLALRKQIQAQRGEHGLNQDEPGTIYIEGENGNWSSDEDVDEAVGVSGKQKSKKGPRRALNDLIGNEGTSEDDEEGDDDMPTANGVASEQSDGDLDSNEEAHVMGRMKGGMYDVEADVSGEEGDSDEDSDEDEEDEEQDEDDSSMDSFINDGEISQASDDDGNLDDEPEIRKPEKKRTRHR